MAEQKIYSVGDKVWVVKIRSTKEEIPCPVCFGDLVVIMILGDGTQVELDCNFCAPGYSPPTGKVDNGHYECTARPLCLVLTGVDQRRRDGKMDVTYWSGCNGYNADRVGATQEEALELGAIEGAKINERKDLNLQRKFKDHKNYTWNAGYYMREAKRSLEEHHRYLKKARIMESKARPRKESSDG